MSMITWGDGPLISVLGQEELVEYIPGYIGKHIPGYASGNIQIFGIRRVFKLFGKKEYTLYTLLPMTGNRNNLRIGEISDLKNYAEEILQRWLNSSGLCVKNE